MSSGMSTWQLSGKHGISSSCHLRLRSSHVATFCAAAASGQGRA